MLTVVTVLAVYWNLALTAEFATGLMDRQRLEPRKNAYDAFVTLPAQAPVAALPLSVRSRVVLSQSPRARSGRRVPVEILYLADIRFPLERANGIQSMETCHALAARGHDVTLIVRPDTQSPARDPFAFYGLPRIPALAHRGGADHRARRRRDVPAT